MAKYLVTTVETYRVDSENEAKNTIEEAKKNPKFTLSKYSSEYKERKLKGEVVDAYYKLTLTKTFTDIKEPDVQASVDYSVENAWYGTTADLEDEEENFDED